MSRPFASARRLDILLLCFCLCALGATIVYPTARLGLSAVTDWRPAALTAGAGPVGIRNTVVLSFLSVATSAVVGVALALLVGRFTFPGRTLLAALAYMPLTLPPLVGVLSFYYIIGRDGFIPRFLAARFGLEDPFLDGPAAILLIHTYSFYVYFYAMAGAALESLDTAQLEAARTLGAGRVRVFRRVLLPMLMPALLGASLLTFMSSAASFSAPYFFGSDFPMLSVLIYRAHSQFNGAEAATLTVVLAGISLLGVLVFRSRVRRGGTASKGAPRPVRSRGGRVAAGLAVGVGVAVVLLPHATIVWLSFVDHIAWHTEIIPTALTWSNYRHVFGDPYALAPIRNSLWMSALGAVAALLVGLPAAYLSGRGRPGGRWVNFLVMIPWALPGSVIAMNLIVAFNTRWMPLVGTIWLIPLAYFVRNVPLLARIGSAAIEPFDATLIEAGRSLGGSPWFCFRRIALPLLVPALAAGAALAFATSLGEFVASILLWVPANVPIAVQIDMQSRGSGIGASFAYSVFLMLLTATTFLVSRRFSARLF